MGILVHIFRSLFVKVLLSEVFKLIVCQRFIKVLSSLFVRWFMV